MSLPSRADTKSRPGGRIGNMWRSGSPIQTYQYMWYIPWRGKGAAIPYIKTSCWPSAITWSRMSVTLLWREMVVMNPLKCHMQRMCYQLSGQPKVNWRAYQTHHQSSVNQSTQDQLEPDSTDEGLQADDDTHAPLK